MDDYLDELLDRHARWREPLGDEPEVDDAIDLHGDAAADAGGLCPLHGEL